MLHPLLIAPKETPMRILLPLLATFAVSTATAQTTLPDEDSDLSRQAAQIAQEALNTYNAIMANPSIEFKDTQQRAATASRRIDDIANETYAQDRAKILDFLGISAQNPSALYYFVSFSMPKPLLQAYVMDALWTGGTLIFRGPKPNQKLTTFITEDLRSLVQNKGVSANLSLDPRLFDLLEIKTVPTIAFVPDRAAISCLQTTPTPFSWTPPNAPKNTPPQTLFYKACNPSDPSNYIKIAGAVSTKYALEQFSSHYPSQTAPFLKAFSNANAPLAKQKDQTPFQGNWDTLQIPTQPSAQ